ncbi:MAG: beta-lactamase family protein [Candidatus Cloacimonetes bacterium]|nr:beta-lactamase family protein [Candidatus Cloacimonadota bacterium]MBS3767527.1 beta-lactamase family protein [Candidatus Cloacimonadota bacterium]
MKKIIIIILLFLLAISGCDVFTSDSDSDDNAEQIKEELYAYFDSLQYNTAIPGIVAGVWMPQKDINWVRTFGYADLENGTPMTPQLIFRIASNTKTMTNTILLQLVEENKISLSDTLFDYIPNFPKADSVTIQMLTDMTSGIRDYIESPHIDEWLAQDPGIYFPMDSLLAFSAEMDYYFSPGEGWHYSNTNTLLIQKIIKQITGNTLLHEMQTRLFDPIDLSKTEYIPQGTYLPEPHAQGYYAGPLTAEPVNYTEVIDLSLVRGAGAAVSDIYELKTYVECLVNGYYLSSEMQEHRFDYLVNTEGVPLPIKYGTGWMEWNGFYGHDGGFPGFVSLMLSNPNDDTTVIFWFNCQLTKYNVLDSFARIYQILYSDKLMTEKTNVDFSHIKIFNN